MEMLMDWKSLGSVLATLMFIRTMIRDFLPPELYQFLKTLLCKLFSSYQPTVSILIEEFENSYTNDVYDAVQSYLSSKCFSSAQVLKLSKSKNSKNLVFTMNSNQKLEETFDDFKVRWSFHSVEKKSQFRHHSSHESRYYELSFHHRHKHKVQSFYIPHVMEVAEMIKFKNRERKLYTNRSLGDQDGRLWSSVPFTHPSTFDTLAIDPVLKQQIKDDLIKFVNRKEYYNRVGRSWKRGYLLYGPPGTGKTSLIAAIANFLQFDIYDLEFTAVTSNSQLRKLLVSTSSKSVIVVEDADCSVDLSDRSKKQQITCEMRKDQGEEEKRKSNGYVGVVSLSGVLNFVDGLWSSCGGERLMIFTTNHKEKLDPALLRSGRMDRHINLSHCGIEAFKTLAKNYLEIEDHELMNEVEKLLPLVKMTPADIAEVFMSCEDDADLGMKTVIEGIKKRLQPCSIGEDFSIEEPKIRDLKVEDSIRENGSH